MVGFTKNCSPLMFALDEYSEWPFRGTSYVYDCTYYLCYRMLYAGDALKETIVVEGLVYLFCYRVLAFCGYSFPFQI